MLEIYANDIQIRSNFVCHLEQHIHEDMPNLSPKEASMRQLENADFNQLNIVTPCSCEDCATFFSPTRQLTLRNPSEGPSEGFRNVN